MPAQQPQPVRLGVIGGSGVYQMQGIEPVAEHAVATPFGAPSGAGVETTVEGRTVVFLPRHGRGHRLLPGEINARANVHALKQLGVTHVLAVSAVGIMQPQIRPGDMVEHPQFGSGLIVSIAGTLATIAFKRAGVKKMMLGVAPIRKA